MSNRLNVINVAEGIDVIDSEYYSKDFAAIYLLRQNNKVAIIETGTNYSIPAIETALIQYSLSFSDVSYVIPTHVHLDHAGGAGALMEQCQNASLVVHPRGSRHLIDPSKLTAGAIAVYGEKKFKEYYGEIIPIDAARVIEAVDNFVLDFQGRELSLLILLDTLDIIFVFGISQQNLCLLAILLVFRIVILIIRVIYIFCQAQVLCSLTQRHSFKALIELWSSNQSEFA